MNAADFLCDRGLAFRRFGLFAIPIVNGHIKNFGSVTFSWELVHFTPIDGDSGCSSVSVEFCLAGYVILRHRGSKKVASPFPISVNINNK
jgi:hypothetical protein